ncbi:zinc finger domain-containing protein [Nocardia sp. CA-128927]|uniref:zinc finger domain-containing protein n=1 Tax=Nocardia sp. CA-128927 TaxID=3239975 RepID=UPI003D97BCE7
MPDADVIALHGPRVQLSQNNQALRTFAIARTECPDCPAKVGEPCVRCTAAGSWVQTRILHTRRTLAAERLITDKATR